MPVEEELDLDSITTSLTFPFPCDCCNKQITERPSFFQHGPGLCVSEASLTIRSRPGSRSAAYVQRNLEAGKCATCPNVRHPDSNRFCAVHLAKVKAKSKERYIRQSLATAS